MAPGLLPACRRRRRQVKAEKIPKCSLPPSLPFCWPLCCTLNRPCFLIAVSDALIAIALQRCSIARIPHASGRYLFSSRFSLFFLFLSISSSFSSLFLLLSSPFLSTPHDKGNGRKRLLEPEGLIGTKFKEKGDETER